MAKHQFGGINQVNNCVYLGGNISENGRADGEVRRKMNGET